VNKLILPDLDAVRNRGAGLDLPNMQRSAGFKSLLDSASNLFVCFYIFVRETRVDSAARVIAAAVCQQQASCRKSFESPLKWDENLLYNIYFYVNKCVASVSCAPSAPETGSALLSYRPAF